MENESSADVANKYWVMKKKKKKIESKKGKEIHSITVKAKQKNQITKIENENAVEAKKN